MSKYAPPDANNAKPYVVHVWEWGQEFERLTFAADPQEARWLVLGRPGVGQYVQKVRRATPGDVERLS